MTDAQYECLNQEIIQIKNQVNRIISLLEALPYENLANNLAAISALVTEGKPLTKTEMAKVSQLKQTLLRVLD